MAIALYWLISLLKLELELSRVYHPHLISPLPPQTKNWNLSVPDFNTKAGFFCPEDDPDAFVDEEFPHQNSSLTGRYYQEHEAESLEWNSVFFFCRGDLFRWFVRCLKGVVWGMFGLNFKLEKKDKYQQKILDVWVGWFSIEEIKINPNGFVCSRNYFETTFSS